MRVGHGVVMGAIRFVVFWIRWVVILLIGKYKCPWCLDVLDGCDDCMEYSCRVCWRRAPWDLGACDDMPMACDDCWAAVHPEAA